MAARLMMTRIAAVVALIIYCVGICHADILSALKSHRGEGSLPLEINMTQGSVTSSQHARNFAKDPMTWRKVSDNVDLVGWYTKVSKVRAGEEAEKDALNDALRKFFSVLGLQFEPEKPKKRNGPLYTIKYEKKSMSFFVGEALGRGSYGEVRIAEESITGELYAMKTEFKHIAKKEKVLMSEFKCYQELSQNGLNAGIPFVVPNSTGVWKRRDAMIMELLGTNLEELFNISGRQFSFKTLLTIMLQLSKSLEKVHQLGYLHRDIKPENCMIGNILGHNGVENSKIVKLADFGFGTKYKDAQGKLLPLIFEQAGTETYMSRDVFEKLSPRPKDDIETLSYVMLYLWLGYMPFVVAEDKDIPEHKLCKKCPAQLIDYLIDSRRKIKENENPNYDGERALLEELFHKKGLVDNKEFDWERKLALLLNDPEVTRIGVASEKVKTEDGTFWISVFLVGKFYVDILAHMQDMRDGLQKLHIDEATTAMARKLAKNPKADFVCCEGFRHADVMIVHTESAEMGELVDALNSKYPASSLKARSFVDMVTTPTNFYVGFGAQYNSQTKLYTFAIVLAPELLVQPNTKGMEYYLSVNKAAMRIAQAQVSGAVTNQDANKGQRALTHRCESDIPLETIPLRDIVSDEIKHCCKNLRENQLGNFENVDAVRFGYSYAKDTTRDKLAVVVTALLPPPPPKKFIDSVAEHKAHKFHAFEAEVKIAHVHEVHHEVHEGGLHEMHHEIHAEQLHVKQQVLESMGIELPLTPETQRG